MLLAEDADLRTKFYLTFQKHGLLLKLAPLPEKQLAGFVESEAKRQKIGLDAGWRRRLPMRSGRIWPSSAMRWSGSRATSRSAPRSSCRMSKRW